MDIRFLQTVLDLCNYLIDRLLHVTELNKKSRAVRCLPVNAALEQRQRKKNQSWWKRMEILDAVRGLVSGGLVASGLAYRF